MNTRIVVYSILLALVLSYYPGLQSYRKHVAWQIRHTNERMVQVFVDKWEVEAKYEKDPIDRLILLQAGIVGRETLIKMYAKDIDYILNTKKLLKDMGV